MADEHDSDRTEDPTQKRLDEALERGDVVKSQEVSTWFVIGGGALMLAAFSGSMSGGLTTTFRGLIANSHQIPVDGRGLISIAGRIEREVLAAIALPLARPGARGACRQHDPAPAGVVGRFAEAEVLQDFAAGRIEAAVLQRRRSPTSPRA